MISQTVNGLERRVVFRPAFHRVDEGYGVHGMEMWFYLIGPQGAVHFGISTGMMLKKTWDSWEKEGLNSSIPRIMNMGIDVGYHARTPQYDGQEVMWPKRMVKKDESKPNFSDLPFDATREQRDEALLNIEWVPKTPEPPVCDLLGVPCYYDGSALRADEWKEIFLAEGDEKIWEMLEDDYKSRFSDKV